jgi:molybdate transport system substrate-binding protein
MAGACSETSRPARPRPKTSGAFRVGAAALAWVCCFALPAGALAADVNVMISGGFSAAYRELTPEFERTTGNRLATSAGPSMGITKDAIPVRLQRGEPADLLIMASSALDELIKQGKVVPGSRVDLARSSISMVVRAGAPKPDISSVDALRRALLAAKSVAYSDSASGIHIRTEVFPRLGIAEQMKSKAREIPGEPVGQVVARGEAEIGFQQLSELLPVPGIQIVGPLPPELQKITIFAAGITTDARAPEAARALIQFLASSATYPVIRKSGLEPPAPAAAN